MKKLLVAVCAAAAVFLTQVPLVQADLIDFDGPGYVAGSTPPAPWTDCYTANGTPFSDLVYQVVAGTGTEGSNALTILDNGYYEGAAVYVLPTPLTSGAGPQRISVMLDPSQNDPYNFTNFGGVAMGRGGWMQNSTATWRGVNFSKEDWGKAGGNDITDFLITGPGGVFGYFVASAAQNYYTISFDINAAFTSILITVTAPGGAAVTQTTSWDGGAINKVWLWDGNNNYSGQPVYYDNLNISIPEPATIAILSIGALSLIRRKK
jgi:hypothetical protein